MNFKYVLPLALFCTSLQSNAQEKTDTPYQIYAGYSLLSNSFNGVPASRQPLDGWNASLAFPQWRHLRFKLDYSMFRGTNLGAPQQPFLILGGGQYGTNFHRERFFVEALAGEAGLNRNWFTPNGAGYKNGSTGSNASFAEFLGGGVDTPISSHFGIRVEGGVQHTNFSPLSPLPQGAPYHLAGVPNYFGRFSTGLVWTPVVRPAAQEQNPHTPVESDIVFEGLNSFGHFKIFANAWWSYLSTVGIEYDRHSWGRWIGARRDYVAEILPVVIVRQPSETDIWGDPKTKSHETVPGIGIFPIGMRLLWNDHGRVMPYYIIKGGMTGYTQKTFSQFAAYENFSLQQTIGLQFRMTGRWGFRAGFEVFHQSNGFVVPSNPGLDAMSYNAGLCYHLGGPRSSQ